MADPASVYQIFSDDDDKFWIACDQIIICGPFDRRTTAEEERDWRVSRLTELLEREAK